MRSVTLAGRPGQLLPQRYERTDDYHPSGGEQGPADRARQLVSAPRARLGAHARRGLHGVRRHGPVVRRAASRRSTRGCTSSPATASGSRSSRSSQGRPVWVDDPHFKRQLPRPPHGAAPPRRRGRAQAARGPRVLPGARPQPAAVGAVAGRGPRRRSLRGAVEDPSRARRRDLRRRHRDRPVRHLAGPAAGGAARPRVGRAPAAEPRPAAGRRAARARDRARPRSCAASARRCAARARWPSAPASALGGVGAMAWAGLQAAPPSPFNVRIGPHRRFTWVRGRPRPVQGDQERARRHRQRRRAGGRGRRARPLHAPARRATEDVVLKAMVPVSVRADVERGALGNRVAAMWAPLPVGLTDPVERLHTISGAMDGIKESGQAVGAQVLTAAVRASRRRRSWPRRRGCRPASGCSTSSSPTFPGRSSRSTCSAASSRRSTRWSRWPRTRRSGSRS